MDKIVVFNINFTIIQLIHNWIRWELFDRALHQKTLFECNVAWKVCNQQKRVANVQVLV